MNDKFYSALDREIITLAAVWDSIGSMVHYRHFTPNHRINDTTLTFQTREASKLFLIVLADFLSQPRDKTFGLTGMKTMDAKGKTLLGLLQRVVDDPAFAGDTTLLASSVNGFANWLDGFATVKEVWLPSINLSGTLRVRRLAYLKICGTASKHGFTRLGDIVKDIRKVLSENGAEIDEGQGYLVIPEFQEWFQDNIFLASSTAIAWHLNEIRWGIYRFLSTEYQRAYRQTTSIGGGQFMYTYDVPADVIDPLVRSMYWDLMNAVRNPPYFPRFTVDQYILDRY